MNPRVENPPVNYTVGIVLFFVFICETVGFFIKSRDIRYRLSQPDGISFETPLQGNGVMVLIAILHIIGSFLICAVMISAFGMVFENAGWMVFFVVFIRELFIWYLAFLATSERSREYLPVSSLKKFIGNACLVFWGLVSYTIVWERFAVNFVTYFRRGDLFSSVGSIIQFAFVILGVVLASLFLFVPTRFGFILEETNFLKDQKDRMYFWLSLGLAVASAILPYVMV